MHREMHLFIKKAAKIHLIGGPVHTVEFNKELLYQGHMRDTCTKIAFLANPLTARLKETVWL